MRGVAGRLPIAPAAESILPIYRLCREDYYALTSRAVMAFTMTLHLAILPLKYEEVTRLGDWFAARLAELFAREPEEFRADVVVPVPLHPDRQ